MGWESGEAWGTRSKERNGMKASYKAWLWQERQVQEELHRWPKVRGGGAKLEYRVQPLSENSAKPLEVLSSGEESQDQICLSERTRWLQPREQTEGGKSSWRDKESHQILPRIADEETKAPRGEATCPRSLSWKVLNPRFNVEFPQLQSPALRHLHRPCPLGVTWLLASKNLSDILIRTGFYTQH